MDFIKEFWNFLKIRKKFWLLPIIIVLVIFGGLISIALYPLLGNWCILFSGLLGGASAILINTLKKRTA